MDDKLTIIICVVVSVAVLLFTFKQYKDFDTKRKEYISNTKSYKFQKFTTTPYIITAIMVIISLALIFYGYSSKNEYVWIGIFLVFMCLSQIITINIKYIIYYSDDDFFFDSNKVLYRNIKGIGVNKSSPLSNTVAIYLFNGPDVIASKTMGRFISEQYDLYKVRKKELKESKKKHAA